MNLFKVITVKDEIVIGLSAAELGQLAGNEIEEVLRAPRNRPLVPPEEPEDPRAKPADGVRGPPVGLRPPGRIAVHAERHERGVAEPHVRKPGPRAIHAEGQVVEGHPERPLRPVDSGGEESHTEAQRLKKGGVKAVQLVAEAAPTEPDDLLEEPLLVEDDRLARRDVEILEGHGEEMGRLKPPEGLRVGRDGAVPSDPPQVRRRLDVGQGQGVLPWPRGCGP